MELDSKQKVLIAIYTEYQKDLPKMAEEIKADKIGLNIEVFKIALDKLQNEGLITGANFSRRGHDIYVAFTDRIMMTACGISYVETKLGIEKEKTGKEKLQELLKKSASWGWNEAKDIIARTLSETMKS